MIRDPYSDLVGILRKEGAHDNAPVIALADVISISPIKIKLSDTVISKRIYINYLLLEQNRLYQGDKVAVQQVEDDFIILCKVVKAG